jgi:hypothetical protein
MYNPDKSASKTRSSTLNAPQALKAEEILKMEAPAAKQCSGISELVANNETVILPRFTGSWTNEASFVD